MLTQPSLPIFDDDDDDDDDRRRQTKTETGTALNNGTAVSAPDNQGLHGEDSV
jgi:hypothetical protein